MTVAEITLARVRQLLSLDERTGEISWRFGTNVRARGVAGYINARGYRIVMIDGKNFRAHRLVWLLLKGSLPRDDLDHINGIRSDNRPCNLREATRSQNNQNQRGPRSDSKSPYLGVTWHAQSRRWAARITHQKKMRHLGLFKTAEEARDAYVTAKRALHTHGML